MTGVAGRFLFAAVAPLLLAAADTGPLTEAPVDPLTVSDDDFARHRDAAEWQGLTVTRVEFREAGAHWRLWRIADPTRPRGPLWVVPHDDENEGFEAGLVAVRRHGGTMVAVDSGVGGAPDGVRRNRSGGGEGYDPNRIFRGRHPRYVAAMLAPLAEGAWPIIALHSNSRGYDPSQSTCARPGDPVSRGTISIHVCNRVFQPVPSKGRAFPFDDDDTVAILPHLAERGRATAFCGTALEAADFNVVHERVERSDGSLSNYAVLFGLDYLNFETINTGREPSALAAARDRLTWMIDRAMASCGKRP